MDLWEYGVGWIAFSILVGAFSRTRGHGFFPGLISSLVLSPLIGAAIVLGQFPNRMALEKLRLARNARKCPACAEIVNIEALVCRYCGRDLPSLYKAATDKELSADVAGVPEFDRRRRYEEGDIVGHREYGRGQVVKVGPDNVVIRFPIVGVRDFELRNPG